MCWGMGSDGQLGDGSMEDAALPVAVAGNRSLAAVATGFRHTIALEETVLE